MSAMCVAFAAIYMMASPPCEEEPKPTEVAHGFGLGARAEFPDEGVAGVLFGYDFGELQLEGSFGALINDDDAANPVDVYSTTFQAFYRVHRMSNADLALGGGGGMFLRVVPGAAIKKDFTLGVGARARIFVAPNAALLGTLGVAVLKGDAPSLVAVVARPLGAVGFEYYFR
jgi:hypothetical protein